MEEKTMLLSLAKEQGFIDELQKIGVMINPLNLGKGYIEKGMAEAGQRFGEESVNIMKQHNITPQQFRQAPILKQRAEQLQGEIGKRENLEAMTQFDPKARRLQSKQEQAMGRIGQPKLLGHIQNVADKVLGGLSPAERMPNHLTTHGEGDVQKIRERLAKRTQKLGREKGRYQQQLGEVQSKLAPMEPAIQAHEAATQKFNQEAQGIQSRGRMLTTGGRMVTLGGGAFGALKLSPMITGQNQQQQYYQ